MGTHHSGIGMTSQRTRTRMVERLRNKGIADEAVLAAMLAEPGQHRCGAALTAARQQTLAAGDLLGLALTATGDGDISLVGR